MFVNISSSRRCLYLLKLALRKLKQMDIYLNLFKTHLNHRAGRCKIKKSKLPATSISSGKVLVPCLLGESGGKVRNLQDSTSPREECDSKILPKKIIVILVIIRNNQPLHNVRCGTSHHKKTSTGSSIFHQLASTQAPASCTFCCILLTVLLLKHQFHAYEHAHLHSLTYKHSDKELKNIASFGSSTHHRFSTHSFHVSSQFPTISFAQVKHPSEITTISKQHVTGIGCGKCM